MGNNDEDSATPLSAIFFKTLVAGVAVGIVLSVITHLLPLGSSAALDAGKLPLVLVSGASLGALVGGTSAACSLALHSLARRLNRAARATAAGVGGAVGVLLPPLLVLGPLVTAGAASWWLPVCMLAGAALAVLSTRPLRATASMPVAKFIR